MSTNWILNDKSPIHPVNAQVDASASSIPKTSDIAELTALMRKSVLIQDRLLASQNRNNELMEMLLAQLTAAGRQRALELALWKQANPRLARACKDTAEKLGALHSEFIDSLSDEVDANFDALQEGGFVLSEFLDKFGSRVSHLNALIQFLNQLGNAPDIVVSAKPEK